MDEEQNNKEETDLSGAEFQNKEQVEEPAPAQIFYPGTPKIVQWLIKHSGGLIKDESQASYVLIGFAAAGIIVSLFLFFGAIRPFSPQPPAGVIDVIAGPEGER